MYANISHLTDRLQESAIIELIDDENTYPADIASANDILKSRITTALSDATAKIDTYLSTRYKVPLSTVPDALAALCADIAIYNLYARRDHAEIPESRQSQLKATIRMLEQIAKGDLVLGIPSVDTPQSERADAADVQHGATQQFTGGFGGF